MTFCVTGMHVLSNLHSCLKRYAPDAWRHDGPPRVGARDNILAVPVDVCRLLGTESQE